MSQLLLSAMEEGKGAFSLLFPPLTTIPSDVPILLLRWQREEYRVNLTLICPLYRNMIA